LEKDPDPTYRGWLETAFAELGAGQAGRLLFDRDHNPLYQIPLSHDGAGALLSFWREQRAGDSEADGPVLTHDFSDPLSEDGTEGWDTRFLGDLYEELSLSARETYALRQTPDFVEEFILDRTMTPAVREFGFEELKMIDPTCGSGHFVLGVFRRLVRMWAQQRPEVGSYERVRASLGSVHGVDLNPFAVAVARFRLLVAAMAASDMRTFNKARKYDWPIELAVGDSLIKDRQLELQLGLALEEQGAGTAGDPLAEFSYATEDVHEYPGILQEGRYHVVVGNPPYITVKDSTLNRLYRDLYGACAGKYALSVPFAQRFFELAKRGEASNFGHGMVGQITANSFMKREFGTKLIETFFGHQVELTEVIDTSGAYIPGHGTPTVILVGKPRGGSGRSSTIRTVRSVQGEPSVPAHAESGLVWRAIVDQIDNPGSTSQWVSVNDLERGRYFGKQPWVLADGGQEMVDQLSDASIGLLSKEIESIGFAAITGDDDLFVYTRPGAAWLSARPAPTRPFVTGDQVRDWNCHLSSDAIFAPDGDTEQRSHLETRTLWPGRTILQHSLMFSKTKEQRGLPWSNYAFDSPSRLQSQFLLTFPFVATHNHFSMARSGRVYNRHAPVVTLREGATEEEYVRMLGLFNSSTAGVWLKMVSH
ncbi:BREX-2 system adenine-specific DNA-methyltransferase PglX, partial [Streptomyces sp. SAS_269]|uniref:BREX-2 system adenine-specific DNA-methyltransferase PglX n=1 Tax=Streptomyces sp. SAS_269 TaxID=3412749 RepID=UPI00403D49B6